MAEKAHIVIIGGGVIGLSAAIALLDHPVSPYNDTVVASDLPSFDSSSYSPSSSQAAPATFASAWAGAHHVSDAKDANQLELDKVTFGMLQKLEPYFGKESLLWVHQTEYWASKDHFNREALEWYPDFQMLPSDALPEGAACGCTLTTYDIVVPQYLPKLYRLFLSLGGQSLQAKVKSVPEALELVQSSPASHFNRPEGAAARGGPGKANGVIVSPGLGALALLGDSNVHPVRGQTLLVRAPWNTTGEDRLRWPGMSRVNTQGFRDMYILPRGDGTFIVGGTRLPDDWDAQPRPDTSQEIIQRALSLMPRLARPAGESEMGAGQVDVLAVNVGLRPARRNGIRLEAGEATDGVAPVVYSYGYGGFGYQCSWGAALKARDLIDVALNRPSAPSRSTLASLDR